MEALDKPQLIALCSKSLIYTVFDAKWIPCSAKFVTMGSTTSARGILQVYELRKGELHLVSEFGRKAAFKCGTFGASNFRDRYLATGNFDGNLQVWNLENTNEPIYSVDSAHNGIINSIDGIGGTDVDYGAPEIITGSRDGVVKVWDVRQKDVPVAICKPKDGETTRDCWSVASGNSYNSEERVVVAGYDNGDIKMFDLRTLSVRWQVTVKNGVCGLEFDRKTIPMNKLVATTLEAKIHVWDLRTQHPTKGFAGLVETTTQKSTIWQCRHLPQNREIFVTTGGAGSVNLWKYNYPDKRVKEDADGQMMGVAGNLTNLQNCVLSSQPISTFDWSPDKMGLGLCTSFDQNVYILIATKLNLF